MSEYQQKPETGSLFKNDKYTEGGTFPYLSGKALINGEEYFVDAWLNKMKESGKPYFSVKFKPKSPAPVAATAPEPEGDLPF